MEGFDHAYEDDSTDRKVRDALIRGECRVGEYELTRCRTLNSAISSKGSGCLGVWDLLGLGTCWERNGMGVRAVIIGVQCKLFERETMSVW